MIDRMKVQGKHNKKILKTRREMVWKQQRNTKMCETVNPFQCVLV